LKTVGEKPTPNPKPEKPKPADTRTEPDPLPSLICGDLGPGLQVDHRRASEVRLALKTSVVLNDQITIVDL
jgi:hypothetical protein